MGFLASLFGQKNSPAPRAAAPRPAAVPLAAPEEPAEPAPGTLGSTAPVLDEATLAALLAEARAHLERKDLPAALQLYEQIAAADLDLSGPFTTISGDLGATGHIEAVIEFLAPRYDPASHGLPAGINLLQAYLHQRNPVAAGELIDLLTPLIATYSMRDRFDGFRTAVQQLLAATPAEASGPARSAATDIRLISISRPIWTYGLEDGENLLPTKNPRARRIGLMPLALVVEGTKPNTMAPPDHPLAGVVRGLPLALAEVCWFCAGYRPVAMSGLTPDNTLLLSPMVFRGEQIRRLFPRDQEPLDYAIAGTVHSTADGRLAALEFTIWDTRKNKLLKALRHEGPDALAQAWPQVLAYIEATKPSTAPLAYTAPADPLGHAAALDEVAHFFLAEKGVLPVEKLAPHAPRLAALAAHATAHPGAPAARLAFFATLRHCANLGLEVPPESAATADSLAGTP